MKNKKITKEEIEKLWKKIINKILIILLALLVPTIVQAKTFDFEFDLKLSRGDVKCGSYTSKGCTTKSFYNNLITENTIHISTIGTKEENAYRFIHEIAHTKFVKEDGDYKDFNFPPASFYGASSQAENIAEYFVLYITENDWLSIHRPMVVVWFNKYF